MTRENAPVDEKSPEYVNFDRIPKMEVVQDTGSDLETDDDTSRVTINNSFEGNEKRSPNNEEKLASRNRRRARGVSFLPVRQSNPDERVHISSPPSSRTTTSANLHELGSPTTPSSSGTSPSSAGARPVNSLNPAPTLDAGANRQPGYDRQSLLSTYINQLATKEARVGDLRATIKTLQLELREAEAELKSFKENGKTLAEIVHSHLPESQIAPNGEIAQRTPTNSESDMLGIGRRVVDEIGSQFWSFLEDVKSATMGSSEFDKRPPSPHRGRPQLPHRRLDSARDLRQVTSEKAKSPSPSPRSLSPKKSIQDFMKHRSLSPIRNPLSPSNPAQRRELAEYHASQRLKESERLTKKLSHLNLKASAERNSPEK